MGRSAGGSGRWLAGYLVCCVAGLMACVIGLTSSSTVTFADASPAAAAAGPAANGLADGGSGAFAAVLGSLVVPGAQELNANQQTQDAAEARRMSPAAFAAREVSQTAYEHFDAGQAKQLAGEAFPKLIDEPAGGPPPLSSGEKVVGYPRDNVAQLVLPGHKRGVIESLEPIALETSPGHRAPIDLGLREAGNGFQPVFAAVKLQIPRHLSDGIGLGRTGVSLTPVDDQGSALAGSQGEVDGTGVIYTNTLTDADTLVKPTTAGFSAETLLRSVDSPRELFFRVGMPSGAKLVEAGDRSGGVSVVDEGATLASITPPSARDAEGTPVPVSMRSLPGNVLAVTVTSFAEDAYRLPIVVDPEVREEYDHQFSSQTIAGKFVESPWFFAHSGSQFSAPAHPEGGSWTETISGSHGASETGGLYYTTHGVSQIVEAKAEGHWNDTGSHISNYMALYTPAGGAIPEDYDPLPEATESGGWGGYACAPARECPETIAGKVSPENHNTAVYLQEASAAGGGHAGSNTLTEAWVRIQQEQPPEVKFNTTSPTLHNAETGENLTNVLYGSGGWLGPHSGAFEVNAKDAGLGISIFRISISGWERQNRYYEDGECNGLQCLNSEYVNQPEIYNNEMPNGEVEAEAYAQDPVGLEKLVYPQKIKVDAVGPHGIKINGFQNGNELPLGETLLKVEATDGEGTTKSSGVKSIGISVDGQEVSSSAASCPEGPCTASTAFTLAARDYSPGQHTMIVTATDNANNAVEEAFSFRVHGASPVSVGPGSVDPSTGQLTLNATDVSLGGASGVSRTYQSRNLTAGAEGPLGPQWAINLGGGEGLTVAMSGNATLTTSGGASTTFTRNAKGEFESPQGDGNLKLEAKEKVSGKGITEYVLSDATSGAKTKFEQPAGAQSTPPTFANEFGVEAAQLNRPLSAAVDSSGDVWVTSFQSDLLEEFSTTGTLLNTYGSAGTAGGQFIGPWGVAIDPRDGNLYVSDQTNNRIEELSSSGSFIKMFGWGVSNGKNEFEICTKECKPGIAGSGNGQFSVVAGVTVDSSGNVWVADYGNNRVQEFNEKGEYGKKFGTVGKGAEQFEGPVEIALSGGNLYITDYGNNRVQEFSTAGVHLGQFGTSGSGNGQFSFPYGIAADPRTGNLYVVDTGNVRVEEFTPAGSFITKFGSSGTGAGQFTSPRGVAVSPSGNVYVVDHSSNYVEEWMRPTWLPTEAGGPEAAMTTTYAYATVEEEGKSAVQPTDALAPIPAGVASCAPLVQGCRELTFEYAKATAASGESPSQWGEYKGRLNKVFFHAYNTSTKAMTETAVAQYSYDKQGRLRAEWDPRISPALKTTYGYDAEGHVTAVSSPGQEPWALMYGTIAGDASTGRLLAVTRPSAVTALGSGEAPVKTAAPALSTSHPTEGSTLSVSTGTWSNSPVAYGYQWERCKLVSGVRTCAPILGATNHTYTPVTGDKSYELAATVTATNADGSTAAETSFSSPVLGAVYWSKSSEFGSTGEGNVQFKDPWGITIGEKGNLFIADSGNGRIEELTSSGGFVKAFGKTGSGASQFSAPEGITADNQLSVPQVYVADSGNSRVTYGPQALVEDEYETIEGSPAAVAVMSTPTKTYKEKLYVVNHTKDRVERFPMEPGSGDPFRGAEYEKFGSEGTGNGQFKGPAGIAISESGRTYIVDEGNGRVEWFSEGSYVGQLGSKGTGNGQFSSPRGIAIYSGDIYVVDSGDNRVEEFNEAGEYLTQFATGSEPQGITISSAGSMYVTDGAGNKVEVFKKTTAPNPPPAPPSPGTSSMTTIHYDVPASGTGAPYPMSKEEVEKWGQKEKNDPVEGTAIFPPDEPQGWPASAYKRATIHYWNTRGEAVNTAVPTGGIATSEYNEAGEVTRALSADDRAAALKDGCKSVKNKECVSSEVSELLDTKSKYNGETQAEKEQEEKEEKEGGRPVDPGSKLLETLGPEHTIKIINGNAKVKSGSEVSARDHVKYYYNEGAKEVEAKTHETYDLATGTENFAETAGKEQFDDRTTKTSYSGQENLGWVLRKPTSATTEPGGLNLTTTTVYQENSKGESTGAVVETRSSKGSGSGSHAAPVFAFQFGAEGTGEGQFRKPMGEAFDSSGNLWIVDSGNDRVQVFSASGGLLKKFGSEGTGVSQFKSPWGIAINKSTGNVYVSDVTNDRVEEFSSTGTFIRTFGFGVNGNGKEEFEICTTGCVAGKAGSGNGQFTRPQGIAIDSAGNVWVVDEGNARVEEFKENGEYVSKFGSLGAGNGQLHEPAGIAISDGNLYVAEYNNSRVQEFSPTGVYINKFGAKGTGSGQFEGAEGIAVDPVTGALYVTDFGNGRVEEFTTGGVFLASFGAKGSGAEQLKGPEGVAVNQAGTVYVADTENNRTQAWEPVPSAPIYSSQFGSTGSGNGQLNHPMMDAVDSSGNLWVADGYNNRVEKFSSSGAFLAAYGKEGSSETEVQFKEPVGIAINQKTGNVYVGDQNNNRVVELSSSGALVRVFGKAGAGEGQFKEADGVAIDAKGNVWVTDYGNDRVEEFSETGVYLKKEFGGKGKENGKFEGPDDIAISGEAFYVTDVNDSRVEEFSEEGKKFVRAWGSSGSGNGQFKSPSGIATDSIGNVYVVDSGNARVQEFSPTGAFLTSFGGKGAGLGQMSEPEDVTVTSAGTAYVTDAGANNRVQVWTPTPRPGNEGAHDTQAIYYSTEANAEYPACGGHPEWAGLSCETKTAAQSGASGTPELPVTTVTYNIWDEVEAATEKFGSTTRTKTQHYDSAGRAETSEETSSPTTDTALPKVTNEYNSEKGTLEKQKATIKGETKTVTSKYDALGRLVEYTDAEGNVTKYAYEEGSDGRLLEMSEGKGKEADSYQVYSYNTTTGFMEKLVDSSEPGMTFTATYDVEGRMLTEAYPNGMTAGYTFNPLGTATGIEYKKEKGCASKCPEVWFSNAIVPSIHGEMLTQTSTLSKENYAYDNDERLTETQEIPVGKGCKSRLYAYDEEGNRVGETTRESSTEACASEGGELQAHAYDSAGRLIDSGVEYETFGNTIKLPTVDAGEHALTTTYYVDSQVESQKQGEQTIKYYYDPIGRTMETVSEGKPTSSKVISHYAGPGEAPSWTSEGAEKWTRNIPGIGGELAAIQPSSGAPVLQLRDLEGDIVGSAGFSETETKLLSTYNSTEFGVPTTSSPPPYSWLGADGVASELASGVSTQGGSSYVPEIGRPLQTGPIASPGAFPDGTGGAGIVQASYIANTFGSMKAIAVQEEAEREEAKKQEEEEQGGFCEKYPDGSACIPAEGNCEVNCLTVVGEGGLTVTGQFGQPITGGSGEPEASAASHKKKYNACERRYNPSDPSEACCWRTNGHEYVDKPGHEEFPPGLGHQCDEPGSPPRKKGGGATPGSPPLVNCPEGEYPAANLAGELRCRPEGSEKNDPPEPVNPPSE